MTRSILAIFAGFVVVVVLSLTIDQMMHVLKVFPPWGEPMDEPMDNLIALSYRCIIGVLGAFATAWLAPASPMRHALIGGAIGTVLSIGGIIATTQVHLGPLWFPVAITLTAVPMAWLGGKLHESCGKPASHEIH